MADYSDAKVYKIYLAGLEEFCYIGSTIIPLNERLNAHRASARSNAKYKFASAPLFEEGNEPIIECLEEVDCETKEELLARERYWLDQFPECLNKKDPLLDPAERHERAKATLLKCYYANREERMQKHKAWIESHKEQQAEYKRAKRRADPDATRAKDKEDYAKRKEKIAAAKKVKAKCEECGKEMNKNSLWLHKKTVHAPNPQ
jgi:hypothetical protein